MSNGDMGTDRGAHERLSRLVDDRPVDVESHLRRVYVDAAAHRRKQQHTALAAAAALILLAGVAFTVRVLAAGDGDRQIAAPPANGGYAVTVDDRLRIVDSSGRNAYSIPLLPDALFPAWSPDGSKLAFAGDGDIQILDPRDGTAQPLTSGAPVDTQPAWSPDGGKIVFARDLSDGTQDPDLFVVGVDESGLMSVTRGTAADAYPSWAPDGSTIAFVRSDGGPAEIMAMGPDGSHVRRLFAISNGGSADRLAWSPDSSQLAFSDSNHIFVMNADGTNVRAITSGAFEDHSPMWSSNGEEIAFVRTVDGSSTLETIPAGGGDATPIPGVPVGVNPGTVDQRPVMPSAQASSP